MTELTKQEAYLAMYAFLECEYSLTNSDDIGGLLDSISFLADGGTTDLAAWHDWEEAVREVKAGEMDVRLIFKKPPE